MNIVKKFNQDRQNNPAATLVWSCDPCLKKSGSSSKAPILVDDDDDDIVILDGPPKEEKKVEIAGKSTNTRPKVQNHPATRPKGVDLLKRTVPSSNTKTQVRQQTSISALVPTKTSISPPLQHDGPHSPAVQASVKSVLTLSQLPCLIQCLQSKPVVANEVSVSSTHLQPMGKPLSTKSAGPSEQENDPMSKATRKTGIRIIDDPFPVISHPPVPSGLIRPAPVQKSSSSSVLVSGLGYLSMEDREKANPEPNNVDHDDDPLEYLTPPPLPLPPVTAPPMRGLDGPGVGGAETLSTPRKADILLQPQSMSNSKVVQEVGLLPSWINVRHSAPDAEPDLWQRAFAARTQSQLVARSHSSTAGVDVPGETQATGTNARKKVKAKPLNEAKVDRSFFFSADAWMNQKRVGLGL